MKKFTKVALGALLLAGATTAVAAPASARVFVGLGGPVAYAPGPVCVPNSTDGSCQATKPRMNAATLSANPLKAREYLAAGLPVVSTAIPEVEILGQCRIGRDPDDFVRQIHLALASPGPLSIRSDAIRGESWETRLAEIVEHVSSRPTIHTFAPTSPAALRRAA